MGRFTDCVEQLKISFAFGFGVGRILAKNYNIRCKRAIYIYLLHGLKVVLTFSLKKTQEIKNW